MQSMFSDLEKNSHLFDMHRDPALDWYKLSSEH